MLLGLEEMAVGKRIGIVNCNEIGGSGAGGVGGGGGGGGRGRACGN